jgi:predicted Rossmann fold nucleotide-binding protein DprA/Smf involved in DNA uptake
MRLMKVAIIGSRNYENTRKIKDALFQLKQKFGDDLIIISGGAQYGADKFARKYALEFGIKYKEFNPAHTTKNLYSAMSDNYYEKPYHVSQFHHRNMLIARDCDVMIAFIPNGDTANGSMSAIKNAKKLKKPVTIIT